MDDSKFSKIFLTRYAEESKADWDYVLKNACEDPIGSQARLFRMADLALKGTDLIMIGSGDYSATTSGI